MAENSMRRPGAALRFRDELRDFLRFLRSPRLGPRLSDQRCGSGLIADWRLHAGIGRILKWAVLLWAVNLIFLGPLAVLAATAGGAQHRLDIDRIPWMLALLWAPVIEEMLFRYGLRQPRQALWVVPVFVLVLVNGPALWTILLAATVILALWMQARQSASGRQPGWHMQRRYRAWFPLAFYAVSLAFAVIHLHNFKLGDTPSWLLPLLVLPQFVTGLVLGWLRVRRGILAAIVLHAMFNGGPLLLAWLFLSVTRAA